MTQLAQFGTATIHEAIGQRGALPARIQALRPGMKLAGRALPVRSPGGDCMMLHRAIRAARPGDVIVADAGFAEEAGPFGDLMTLSAQAAGIAGLVISGAVRDSDDLTAYGFPVFCIGHSIKGTTKTCAGPVPDTITIGGVQIAPGDIIVANADGVVVVPGGEEAEAIRLRQAREDKEASIRSRMKAGETLQDIMGL
jgi:4-hydroxy-4-methyl-2-oxoglutarate aldolase